MKIALVSPYDYPYPGGVTAHISHLEREFTRLGHEVKIIAPSSSNEKELHGGNIHKVGSVVPIPANGSMARITLSLRMSGRVKSILREENFDVIHLHEPLVPGMPLTVLHHSKAVNVGTFHAYWGIKMGYFYSNPILRRFFRKLHSRIAVSESALKFVSGHFHGQYEIVPNGIDVKRFDPQGKVLEQFKDGKLNVLFVGRLDRRKGFKYLLKAFSSVHDEYPNVRLLVAGNYGDRAQQRYEKYVVQHGLQDVHFLGYLSLDQLADCYRTADVFCAPSTGGESFGIILLEAMAAAKPIVAANIEGYRALIQDGENGLLVPAKNAPALAQGLVKLLRDPELRRVMGQNGYHKAQDYSWEKIAQSLLKIYERAAREKMIRERARRRNKRSLISRSLSVPKKLARGLINAGHVI